MNFEPQNSSRKKTLNNDAVILDVFVRYVDNQTTKFWSILEQNLSRKKTFLFLVSEYRTPNTVIWIMHETHLQTN